MRSGCWEKLERKPAALWNREKLSNPESFGNDSERKPEFLSRGRGKGFEITKTTAEGIAKALRNEATLLNQNQEWARAPGAAGAAGGAAEELPATRPPCWSSCANPPGWVTLPAEEPQDLSDGCCKVCGRRWDNAVVPLLMRGEEEVCRGKDVLDFFLMIGWVCV